MGAAGRVERFGRDEDRDRSVSSFYDTYVIQQVSVYM